MSETGATAVIERELDLRSEMPFASSKAQLHQLLAIARHVDFHAGDKLFQRGAPIEAVYMLTHGVVEIVLDGSPSWRVVGPGAVGFLDFMMTRSHTRTAIARGDVRALEIDAADYREYMQDNVDIGQQMLAKLSSDLFDDMLESADPTAMLSRAPVLPAIAHGEDPTLVERLLLLQRVPAFARATVQTLANLAQNARIARYPAGQVIELAGVRCDALSILIRGEVELVTPGSTLVARRGPVDLVCDVAELATSPRQLTARAVHDSLVLRIDFEELLDRIDEHFELAQSLFAYVARQREGLNDAAAAARATAGDDGAGPSPRPRQGASSIQ